MDRHLFRSTWLQVVLHSVIGIVLSILLWSTGLLQGIEAKTFDLRALHAARQSSAVESIVLVYVDQESLKWVADNMGIVWPWPRELFGAIISNCSRRGARAIGFDILFTESSASGVYDDEALAQAIRKGSPFALGSVFPTDKPAPYVHWPAAIPPPTFNSDPSAEKQTSLPVYRNATFPIDVIGKAADVLANVNQKPDEDGIYRRIQPFVLFDGKPLPNLGIALYLAAHPQAEVHVLPESITVDGYAIPVNPTGAAILKYRGPSGTYTMLNAASLIRQEFRLRNGESGAEKIVQDLAGKYVLFGYTAPGLFDLRPTPTDGIFSGVEINATALDNLLSRDFIHPVSQIWTFAAIVVLTIGSVFLVSILPSFRSRITTALLILLLPMALAWILYQQGYDFKFVPVQLAIMAGMTISILQGYFMILGKERFIRHSFKHYLSPVVIEELINNPERLQLGGQRKELTMFFSDLQGFTKISEGLEPRELIYLLNEYLTAMTDIILEEEGTVDKFVGDAIIAFWNAPLDIPEHPSRAVRAALRCQEKLAELRPYLQDKYGKEMVMRIGINTGYAIAGNMGSAARFDYTILGDSVNLAARLEGANKYFGTTTMISAATFERLDAQFTCRELGRLRVVGKKNAVTVYEPLACGRKIEDEYVSFKKALAYFYAGDFSDALFEFNRTAFTDPAAEKYCIMCKKLLKKRPEKWGGVCELNAK